MKSKLRMLLPLFLAGCTTTNELGRQEVDWTFTLVGFVLLTVAVVAAAIGLGNMIKS